MSFGGVIPAAWQADPFLMEMVEQPMSAVSNDAAIVVEDRARQGRAFLAAGVPSAIADLLQQVDRNRPFVGGSMMRGTWELLPAPVRRELDLPVGEDWNWMETTGAGHVPGMEHVRELDRVAERETIDRVRRTSIPHSYLSPDTAASRWFGIPGEGGLIRAIGGATGWDGTRWVRSAHLGSIGTEPGSQGRGIGAALTAGIASRAFAEGAPRVSLGVVRENARAIELYQRLGFRTTYKIHSRRGE